MCECRDGQMCNLHQFMWETRMKAQALIDNPPKLTRRQKLAVWWACYNPITSVRWDEFFWYVVFWIIVMRLLFG